MKTFVTLAILAVCFAVGYGGSCEYKLLHISSASTGTSWTVNAYFSDSKGQICIGTSHLQYGCNHGVQNNRCDSFKGMLLCHDHTTNDHCVGISSSNYQVTHSYNCQSRLSCSKARAQDYDKDYAEYY